ncbi:MAG: aldo/keto reductase [Alphaproteobacteria bacterium]
MDPMETRQLGKTSARLPVFGFGGAPLGELFTKVSDEDGQATLAAAWDAGVRYFDTAPWYGRGQSEHRMGRFLYRKPRTEFVLSTKVGRVLTAPRDPAAFDTGFWAGGLHFDIRFDYGYDGIMRSFEDSLQRLGMNRIDLLLIHDLDWWHHRTDAAVDAHLARLATSGWRALDELKSAGLIKGIGAGINENGMMSRFLDIVDIDFFLVALRYTLMEQDTLERELPACEERNVGIVVGGVFSSGILATGAVPGAKYNYADADAAALDKVRRIEAICARHGVPLIAAALQFPLHHPAVASVIPGAVAPGQVLSNLKLMRQDIPPDLWAELKHEKLLRVDAPTP